MPAGILRTPSAPVLGRDFAAIHASNRGIDSAQFLLRANHVSIGESGDEYFQVSFHNEASSGDDFDLSGPDRRYLVVQCQFEHEDGGVCYIDTHDHDTYTGQFRLRLIEFTPTRLAFEIARTDHKYVEVRYVSFKM